MTDVNLKEKALRRALMSLFVVSCSVGTFAQADTAPHAVPSVHSAPPSKTASSADAASGSSTASSYLQRVCDPTHFGAMADGRHDDTSAIQQAINQCGNAGGGTVPLHAGTYLSAPLSLASRITLNLEAGSHLRAIGDRKRFQRAIPGRPTRPGEALIMAHQVHDVAILGSGTIDGDGWRWWQEARSMRARYQHHERAQADDRTTDQAATPSETSSASSHPTAVASSPAFGPAYPGVPGEYGLPRPWLIEFSQVKHARIGGVLAKDAPMWTVVLRDSADVRVTGLHIVNPASSPDTDGIAILASQAIVMNGVDVDTGGDDIAIKSGMPGASSPSVASSDIALHDATIRHGDGVSVGCETANGIEGVHLSDVHFVGTAAGLRIKSARGVGADIGDIDARRIRMDNVAMPIRISDYMGRDGHAVLPRDEHESHNAPTSATAPLPSLTSRTPHIHDVSISDLVARGARDAGFVVGLPEAPVIRLVLRRVDIQAGSGLVLRNVHGTQEGVRIVAATPALHLEANTALALGRTVD